MKQRAGSLEVLTQLTTFSWMANKRDIAELRIPAVKLGGVGRGGCGWVLVGHYRACKHQRNSK